MEAKKAHKLSRRDFLKSSSAMALTAGMGLSVSHAAAQEVRKVVSANEKIVLGCIGLGGRGMGVMNGFMRYEDVEIGAVCDVSEERRNAAVEKTEGKAKAFKDFREVLEQKDIDAVVITTPPHWHPLMSIYACQAGKDVYCEKPISRYPAEAIAMAKAARDNKRVTQVGTQIHSLDNFRRCVEIVQSGKLGKVMAVRVICTMNEYPGGIGKTPDSEPPPGLDWDAWLGPAPKVPYNEARFKFHRYFKDYVASWLSELGPHILDLAFWAMDPGQPLSAYATGGRFVADDISDIPDTVDAVWEFPGFTMSWINMCGNSYNFDFGGPPDGGRRLGVIFHGTDATLLGDYGSHKVVVEKQKMKEGEEFTPPPPTIPSSPGHDREFLDAIKTRQQPSCNFDYHLPIAIAIDIAHISMKVGRKVRWDAKKGEIIGDKEANELVTPVYRKPWVFPKV
ncbi:MAG: Gfo/Idh/MocA family oxidoreductase [Armatimonadota bacterium]|nr:Gfo/Idh/MocA family oxidoreductase [Armatimonadota bacterium]